MYQIEWIVFTVIYIFFYKKLLLQIPYLKKHRYLIDLSYILIGFALVYLYFSHITIFKTFVEGLVSNTAILVATIGFILQNTIKNIVAGFLIAYSKSFQIGDRITIRSKDLTGIVETITLRHTILRTYTNERVIVPNSVLNEEVLINNDLLDTVSGFPLEIPIQYLNQVELAKGLIEEIVLESVEHLDRDLEVSCSDIRDGKIILKVFIWSKDISDNFKTCSKIRYKIIQSFLDHQIKLG